MDVASACSGSPKGEHAAKTKFFQWAVKWFYSNVAEVVPQKPDTPALACLLQSIGFQLREFEKVDDNNRQETPAPSNDTVRVYIECGKSGMRARLELSDVKCQCPNSEIAKDAEFWSITGTGPAVAATVETNRIEESGSNLLPSVSKETSKILHDVTYHLLNIINDKTSDINENIKNRSSLNITQNIATNYSINESLNSKTFEADPSTNIVRSHTQPEIVLSAAITGNRRYNWSIRTFDKESRGIGYDKDQKPLIDAIDPGCGRIENDQPRPSPQPMITSSPVSLNQFSSSLSQLSLQSEGEPGSVTEHVVRAHKSLEKALDILFSKKSPNSRNSSTFEQGTFLKPVDPDLNRTDTSQRLSSGSSRSSYRTSPAELTKLRSNSSSSLSMRENSTLRPIKANTPGSAKASPLSMTRRSVSSITTSPTLVAAGAAAKRYSNVQQQQNSTISKIPARRKSFSTPNNSPLSVTEILPKTARAVNSKGINNNTISPNQKSIIKKSSSSTNSPYTAGNLKFGYAKKKSSIV